MQSNVELSIISITLKIDATSPDDTAKRQQIQTVKDWTCAFEVKRKPLQNSAKEANTFMQSVYENSVVDCTQVKENEGAEFILSKLIPRTFISFNKAVSVL